MNESVATQTGDGRAGDHSHLQAGQTSEVVDTQDNSVSCAEEERQDQHTERPQAVNSKGRRRDTLSSEDLIQGAGVIGCQGQSCGRS